MIYFNFSDPFPVGFVVSHQWDYYRERNFPALHEGSLELKIMEWMKFHIYRFNAILEKLSFQWKKKMEKQRAAIKFKAAARIATVTYDLNNILRYGSGIEDNSQRS